MPGAARTIAVAAILTTTTLSALTLEQAREAALAGHPALAAATARGRAAEAAGRQAALRPNPRLSLAVEGFGGELGSSATESVLALEQTIEIAGKRRLRIEVAAAARRGARSERAAVRAALLADVDRRFAALLAAQERAGLAEQARATAVEVLDAVSALAEAGEVAEIERVRAGGERAMAEVELEGARAELVAARAELALVTGLSADDRLTADGSLVAAEPPPLAQLLDRIDQSPELRAARAVVAGREAEAALIAATRVPDIGLVLGGKRFQETGDAGFVAGVGFDLPLSDRRQGARAEAQALAEAARLDERSLALALEQEVIATHAALAAAVTEERLLAHEVVPAARETYEALGEGYRRGRMGLLDLLSARRGLAEARSRLLSARLRAAQAAADLDRLLGPPGQETGVEP